MFLPHVIEKTGRSTRPIDLPSRLLQDRIIYLGGPIDSDLANIVNMQLLWLQADDPVAEINLYINSPGGCVYSGLSIKDIIDSISCKVNTLGTGMCASMGAYLLACGTGERKATKNCRIMIHSVSSGMGGTYHDLKIDYEETHHLQSQLIKDISDYTKGKSSLEDIDNLCQRDFYMNVDKAVEIGIIDTVI